MTKLNYLIGLALILGMAFFSSCGEDENMVSNCEDFSVSIEPSSSDSTIVATVSNGTAPYTYLWETGETSSSVNVTSADTYEVSVTDANGCVTSNTYAFGGGTDDCDLELTGISLDTSGNVAGYILTPEFTGGDAPFIFEWSTGETTESITADEGGDYDVVITDSNGCVERAVVTVPGEVDACVLFSSVYLAIDSFSGATFLEVFAQGGTEPYAYTWSTGETTARVAYNENIEYSVDVVDQLGCTSRSSYEDPNSDPCLNFRIQIQTLIDSTDNSLFFDAVTSGGTSPYTWMWSTGEFSQTIRPTAQGVYSVTATDSNGCIVSEAIDF